MTKEQIADEIKMVEVRLSELRAELNKPEGITDFKVGDVYTTKDGSPVVIVLFCGSNKSNKKYGFAGLNGLVSFSNFENGATKEEVLKYLNERKNTKLKGNINQEVAELIKKYANQ